VAICSCNSSKSTQSDEFLRIGNGGGFTGIETIYTVFKNGQVESGGKVIKRLKSSDTDQLFGNIDILKLNEIDYNKPGNLYKFIEYTLNGKTHKIAWDSNSTEVDQKLILFYDHVNFLIQKSSK
jgi:hypothetical protein